ncbi:acetylxylan esterase [Sphingobium sp. EP60837]|uniref:acetylxylan esterase n=1 Tax=Sphingobium sp. EP60837 TaxID=1855519 RepID=UPI0018D3A773|nr:acetylxylan esterase [Sphingobium sp. EP60837]
MAVCLSTAGSAQEATQATAEALKVTPDHATGVYAVREPVGWTFAASGSAARRYTYAVRENNKRELLSGELDLSSGEGRITTELNHPGMLLVRLTPTLPTPLLSTAVRNKLTIGAAVAPERIRPGEAEPEDFDAFWSRKLKAQAAVPLNATETPVEATTAGIEMSSVTFDALGSKAHGYLAKPSGPGKYPALIIFQYAGVYKLPKSESAKRAKEGWLVLNIQAHDMAPDEATAPSDYFLRGNRSRETSYFLGMYLRASRAVDYLRSRPEWDGRTIVVTGASQGGQQSFAAAGLNPGKITAVVVIVPAGADITGDRYGRRQGYPSWTSTDPAVVQTGRYFDIINFAPRIRAPTVAAVGLADIVAPPAGIVTAVNRIKAPKEAVLMVEADHTLNHINGNRRVDEALAELRRMGRLTIKKSWGGTAKVKVDATPHR